LPSLAVDSPFSYLKPAIQFYEEDLLGYRDITEAEFKLWQSKWKTVGSKFRPLYAINIQYINKPGQQMFPNIHQLLKLVPVLPVSTAATAERSFSFLRRLKPTSGIQLQSRDLSDSHYYLLIEILTFQMIEYNTGKARRLKLSL